ncbi:BTAD domain-containing putative transcriptional regulator [Plantactinospora sp. WMMB334]|uniref:AfsR/SARP family transcriptional regulator n=1 Tax=Plantactinospora sp. WMMB334 TaxID=3404119 RepID=UPI003B93A53F
MKFRILGTLEISAAGRQLDCAASKPRTVLGLLLCRANRIVPVPVLREALWDGAPPRTAHKNLQSYVSALRALLGTGGVQVLHRPPGYLLRIEPERLDALRFTDLARQGRLAAREGRTSAAAELLGQAIRLWRGPVLPDLAPVPAIAAEAATLRERYLVAYEDWAEASLALGRHADLVDGLDELCWEHPFRERLRHAQMLALYRAGRQTEALAQFDAHRQALARELGLTPSPLLTRLHEAILTGDPGLAVEPPGRARPVPPRCAVTEVELARDVADFTGRAREVGTLLDILGAATPATVVTVSGAAGVGKTALAVHCAHRLGARYPDGRVLVRLRAPDGRPRTVADVVSELLHGLGRPPEPAVAERSPEPPEPAVERRPPEPAGGGSTAVGARWSSAAGGGSTAALLREATAGRRVLFVFDDAAGEEQVGPLLAAAGDAAVLITGRRRPTALESAAHLRLEPMTVPESLSLLSRLVGAGRVAAEAAAAQRLAEICDGLPLAVRIAGAKLAAVPHLPLSRYADRLSDEHRVLEQLRAGDRQVRTRLVRWLDEAAPDDRAALRRLAACDGPEFTAAEAAAALGLDAVRTEVVLERLVEAHLVEAHPVAPHLLAVPTAEVQAHAAAPADGTVVGDGLTFALPGLLRALLRDGGAPQATGALSSTGALPATGVLPGTGAPRVGPEP